MGIDFSMTVKAGLEPVKEFRDFAREHQWCNNYLYSKTGVVTDEQIVFCGRKYEGINEDFFVPFEEELMALSKKYPNTIFKKTYFDDFFAIESEEFYLDGISIAYIAYDAQEARITHFSSSEIRYKV